MAEPHAGQAPTARKRAPIIGIVVGLVGALFILIVVSAQVSHSGLFAGAGLSGTYIASNSKTMPSIAPEVVFNRDGSFLFRLGEAGRNTISSGTYKINGNGSTLTFTPANTEAPAPSSSGDQTMERAFTEAFTIGTLTQDKNNFTIFGTDFERWTEDADTILLPASEADAPPALATPAARLSDNVTLAANNATTDGQPGWYTSAFHLDNQTSLTLTLSAQSSCQADITTAPNLENFKTNKAFDGFCAVTNESGPKTCTLPPGDYYVVARNSTTTPNPVSFQISY